MKYSEARQGRVFIIRLEHGDVLHETVETFARDRGITAAALIAVGGADAGSRLVVGPADGSANPVEPMELSLQDVHEVTGSGTIFPGENDDPILHMHLACGREDRTTTGCVRRGVRVWHVMELVLFEIVDTKARRVTDPSVGFQLLIP